MLPRYCLVYLFIYPTTTATPLTHVWSFPGHIHWRGSKPSYGRPSVRIYQSWTDFVLKLGNVFSGNQWSSNFESVSVFLSSLVTKRWLKNMMMLIFHWQGYCSACKRVFWLFFQVSNWCPQILKWFQWFSFIADAAPGAWRYVVHNAGHLDLQRHEEMSFPDSFAAFCDARTFWQVLVWRQSSFGRLWQDVKDCYWPNVLVDMGLLTP